MSTEMKEPGEKNEKRMHVEIIKVSSTTKPESCSNSLSSGLDLEDDLMEDLSDADLHDPKINSNHNHDIPVSARSKQSFVNGPSPNLQSANQVPNKENNFLNEPLIKKEKEPIINGNQILTNSKAPKPKEYKFVKNKGRWVCKDTKEIKNEGTEIKILPPSNGKFSDHHSNQLTTSKPPTPAPIAVPNPDFPDVSLKPASTEHNSNAKIREGTPKSTSILQNPQEPLEKRMNSVINDSWDTFRQGLVLNLSSMCQQETHALTERISQLIGLLTALQQENTQLRAELDKYRAKQPPPN